MKTKLTIMGVLTLLLIFITSTVQANANLYVAPGGNDSNDCLSLAEACVTIQAAIDKADAGDTINVAADTYAENLLINKNMTLVALDGRENTIIEGISGVGALGTVLLDGTTTAVTIEGFTILGIDNGTPGIENAAVYVKGIHSNTVIQDNEIVAQGDAGLLSEWGATVSAFIIDGNIFSGQTFLGSEPGGCGFGQQFTEPNVPRQLVAMGNGGGNAASANATNITFTNNQIVGTAGGPSTVVGCEVTGQGNTLVTLDVANSAIENNTFDGETTRFGTSLRVRRPDTTIANNTFLSDGLGMFTGHVFFQNASTFNMGDLVADNDLDKGVYGNPAATAGTLGIAIQPAIDAASHGATIYIYPGVYTESANYNPADNSNSGNNPLGMLINKSVSIIGVDAAGVPITDAADVAATVISSIQSNWGTNFFVTAPDVTISGLELLGVGSSHQPLVNKAIEIVADNFTLEHSVVGASGNLPMYGAVYINDLNVPSSTDPDTFVSEIAKYRIANNELRGSFTATNGPGWGIDPNDIDMVVAGNQFVNSPGSSVANAGIGIVGYDDDFAWRNAPAVVPAITGNTFDAGVSRLLIGVDDDPSRLPNLAVVQDFLANNTVARAVYITDPDGDLRVTATATSNAVTVYVGIQTAVTAATPGDTVNVAEGTYVEQVVIGKDLTLQSLGVNKPVIQAPPASTRTAQTIPDNTRTFDPIIFIDGGAGTIDVTVDGFEIDGQDDPGSNTFVGILARNVAPGLIVNNDLHSLMGGQETLGISVYGTASGVTVADNTVTDFSRNGITIVEAAQADVADNVVIGRGYVGQGFWAQNGIQLYQVASGTVSGNTLSDIGWIWPGTGTAWTSTGILIWENDGTTLVEDNNLTNVQVGIRFSSSSFEAVGNTVLMLDSDGLAHTGGIWGNPQGRPNVAASPFDIPNDPTALMSSGTLSFLYENNIVVGDGAANSWGVSIWPYTGFDVDAFATGNTVQDWDIGFDIWGGDSFDAAINWNQIEGNNYGVYNSTDTVVDAKFNWWGDASGPFHVTTNVGATGDEVSDNVEYSPWLGDVPGTSPMTYHVHPGPDIVTVLQVMEEGDTLVLVTGQHAGGIVIDTPGIKIKGQPGAVVGPGSPAFTVAAADVTLEDLVIDGEGSTSPGVLVTTGGDNLTIYNSEILDWATGVEVEDSVTSFKLFDNWIHSNAGAGLQINSGVTLDGVVSIQGNLFKDNGGNGIQHDGNGTLPATYNSWGDVAGPASGDGVSTNVTFEPWTFAEVYMDVDPDDEAIQRDVNEGDTFDVALKVEAANLYGLSFVFSYDDDLLTYDGLTFSSPWDGTCLPLTGLAANEIGYQCALTSGAEWNGGTVATFSFEADLPGILPDDDGPWQALFDISHEVADTSAGAIGGAKVFVNNAGFNLPSDADRDITDNNDGQIDITGLGNFTGFVNLQGRTNDSGAVIQVYDQEEIAGSTLLAEGTSAASGAYTTAYVGLNQLFVGGTYYFQINRPLFLPTTIVATTGTMPAVPDDWAHSAGLLLRPLTSLNTVLLLGGDATNSNYISIGDASCIGSNYGSTTPGVCGTDGTPDVNEDGIVNILDLTLMGGNFDKNFSPWTP
jgi:hypothetical protein